MRRSVAGNFLTSSFVLLVVALVLFPLPFTRYMKYNVSGAYISLVLIAFLIPVVFFYSKSYWHNKITIAVWSLRMLASIEFLATSFALGISGMDLVSFAGTLGLTFFYEMGYLFVASGYFRRFLHFWLWLNMALVAFVLAIVVPIAMRGGIAGIINHVDQIRAWDYYWPNHFAIFLMILFWVAIFLAYTEDKKYLWLLVPILAILFLTSSRTAVVALGGTVLFAAWHERKRIRPAVIALLLLLIFAAGYFTFKTKAIGFGTSLSHTVIGRQLRWDAALSKWMTHPLLGYGFRSFTTIVPTFHYGNGVSATGSSHNDYVDLLLRGGLLYSIPFWLFVLIVIQQGFYLKDRKAFRYLSYSIIGLLIAALFQNAFKDPVILAYFWSYAAAVGFYAQKQHGDDSLDEDSGGRLDSGE